MKAVKALALADPVQLCRRKSLLVLCAMAIDAKWITTMSGLANGRCAWLEMHRFNTVAVKL